MCKFSRSYFHKSFKVDATYGYCAYKKETCEHITILGDKGYANKHLSLDLETEKGIQLIFMKRDNTKNPHSKWFHQLIFKIRRRIETTFSQLAGQLNINKVLTKSMLGLIARLRTKILAYNLCYSINQMLGSDINLGQIKELIFDKSI